MFNLGYFLKSKTKAGIKQHRCAEMSHFLHCGLVDGLFFDQLKSIYPPYLAQALINNIKEKTIYYPYLWRGGVGVSQLRVSHGSNVTKEEISGVQMWSDFQQHPYQTQILKNYFKLFCPDTSSEILSGQLCSFFCF